MNEVPDVPPAQAGAEIRTEPVETGEAAPESRQAFDGALAQEGGLHDAQAPETRAAIGKSLARFQSTSAPQPSGQEETALGQRTETEAGVASSSSMRASDAVEESGDTTRREASAPARSPAAQPAPVVAERPLPRTVPATADAPPRAEASGPADPPAAQPAPVVAERPLPRTVPATADRPGNRATEASGPADSPAARPAPVVAERPLPRTVAPAGDAPPRALEADPRTPPRTPDPAPGQGTGRRSADAETANHAGPSPDTRESRRTPADTQPDSMPRTRTDPRGATEPTADSPAATPLRNPGPAPADARPSGPAHGRDAEGRGEQAERGDAPDPAVLERTDLAGTATPVAVPETQTTEAPATVQTPSTETVAIAREVAERIVVSAPRPGAPDEVRISLNASVLDGSDVRIFREAGELRVVFVAQTESAQRFLADNRAVLQQTLGERLQDERVHVEIGGDARRGASRDGASREDAEGRSRQQYVPQDDSSGLT